MGPGATRQTKEETTMFGTLVQISEATRLGAGSPSAAIIPAFCGCIQCGTRRMIAAPTLGACDACGSDLQVLV
jgi:hypothetical protein